MNRILADATALGLYGQITVQDVGTADLPDWQTGEEWAVATEHAISIATRPDTDGDVVIIVLAGTDDAGLGKLVFDGEISLTSPLLEVGNAVAATVARVDVGRTGYLPLRIYTEPGESPARVTILLGPEGRTTP